MKKNDDVMSLAEWREASGFEGLPPSHAELAAARAGHERLVAEVKVGRSGDVVRRVRHVEFEREYAVAKVLQQARERAHLTQEEMASRLRTSQSQVTRIEGGRRNVTLATLGRYAEACGCELEIRVRRRKVLAGGVR